MQGFRPANPFKQRKQPKKRQIAGSFQRYLEWERKKQEEMREEKKQ